MLAPSLHHLYIFLELEIGYFCRPGMVRRSRAAQENFMWWEQQEGHHIAQGEALWSVPGADTSSGESALVFISPVSV